jgi:quinol monooxygenase YgiN
VYSINVTGYIPQQKSKEFKQHMRQLIGQQNEGTIKFSVLQDMINEDLYEVNVSFSDKERMFSFMKSENYAMISGSFRVLGMLREKFMIEYSDMEDEKLM